MKTSVLGLLATTVLGLQIHSPIEESGFDTESKRVYEIDDELEPVYWLAPGEIVEFILSENPTTGYEWKYDETIINDTFTVDSYFKQDKSCNNVM